MAGEPTVGLKAVFDGTAAIKGIKNVTDSIKATEKAAKSQSSATGGILRLQRSVQSLISTYAAVAAGAVAVGAAVWTSIKAYAAAEAVQLRLERAVATAGGSYEKYDAQVQKVLSTQSRLAAVDDELAAESLTKLVQMTGSVTEAMQLNQLALDMSRATGKDLITTATVIGKVYGGNVGALKRYGIVVQDGATATEALGELQKKYAGYAEDYGKSTAGSADRMATSWGNLKESAGKFAVDGLKANEVANRWSVIMEAGARGDWGSFFWASDEDIRKMDELDGKVKDTEASTNGLTGAMRAGTRTTEDAAISQKRYAQAIKDVRTAQDERVDSELNMLRAQERVEELTKAETEAIKKYGSKSREAKIATLELKQAKREAASAAATYKKRVDEARSANERLARQKALLDALRTLAKRWDDVARAAQRAKDAAIRAGKSIPQAAADARSAGLQEALSPKKNARGGVYPGNRPTLGLLGEASWGDVVVPMNRRDSGAYDLLATAMKGLGVGGGVTLNVTGSKSDAQHLAVATKAALYELLDK